MKTVFFLYESEMWRYQLGLLLWDPDQRTFREKSFGISKDFVKINGVFGAKVFADFQGAFYKKPLEARFGTAVPTYSDKK